MKLITIVNAHNVIDGLSEREDIGAHLAYWLTKFVAVTQSDARFYQSEIMKLFEKYGTKAEEGNYSIPEEHFDDFQQEVEALQNTDAQDPGIRFSLSELADGLKLSLKQMYPLLDFINEDK